MRIRPLIVVSIVALCLSTHVAMCRELAEVQAFCATLVKKIPPRQHGAMTGSEFAAYVDSMDRDAREHAIESQLTQGNIPEFLRRLKPVRLTDRSGSGKAKTATVFVMPDYVSVGSDRDYLLTPMNLYTAVETAVRLGLTLPTKKIVDAIYGQSDVRCTPQPLPAGPRMRSTAYYVEHNQKIRAQLVALACAPGALVSGHKKDLVLTNRLIRNHGKIAIYGWHRPSGLPIQPLSTVHGANYADYSHGIRLISDMVLVDNEPRSVLEVLEDPRLASVLSDEGPMPGARQFMDSRREAPTTSAQVSSHH
ncbi:MAG TPA: hypothetical protein VMT71_06860 [Syntrophorhabdales bacterium]|nr:hypothetical protein [Syntrophorhabdales bacterium]